MVFGPAGIERDAQDLRVGLYVYPEVVLQPIHRLGRLADRNQVGNVAVPEGFGEDGTTLDEFDLGPPVGFKALGAGRLHSGRAEQARLLPADVNQGEGDRLVARKKGGCEQRPTDYEDSRCNEPL